LIFILTRRAVEFEYFHFFTVFHFTVHVYQEVARQHCN